VSLHIPNRVFVVAQREVTYGVDSAPAGGGLIEVYDLKSSPSLETISRTTNKANMSAEKSLVGKRSGQVTFKTPLWGPSGAVATVGSIPRWTRFIKACSMVETFVANASDTLACSSLTPPQTNGPDSMSIWILDSPQSTNIGTVSKLQGCVGSAKIVLTNGQFPYIEFTFQGRWNTPTAYAGQVYTGSEETTQEQAWLGTTLTLIKDVGGTNTDVSSSMGPVQSVEIDLGLSVQMREDCQQASGVLGFLITARAAKITFTPERLTPSAAINWWSLMTAGTPLSLKALFGAGATWQHYVKANTFVITGISGEERNGVSVDKIEGSLYGNDNEMTIFLDCAA